MTITQPTLWGRDDTIHLERKRRRAMAPKVVEPAIPEGDCCGRCSNWRPPLDGDAFGSCRRLGVVTERVPDGPAKGQIVGLTEAVAQGWPVELMAVKGFVEGCSAFANNI